MILPNIIYQYMMDRNRTNLLTNDPLTMSEVSPFSVPVAMRMEFLPAMGGWSVKTAVVRNVNLTHSVGVINPETNQYESSTEVDPVLEYEVVKDVDLCLHHLQSPGAPFYYVETP